MERLKDILIVVAIAAAIFATGYISKGILDRNTNTTVIGKTIYINIPGYVDNTSKPAPVKDSPPLKKDSSDYWKAKYDSIQSLTQKSDTSKSADSVRAEYFHPYQITVEDSLTTNWATIFPLNPRGTRARIDSTRYKPIELSYTYLDTTVNVTRENPFRTYGVVAAGAGIGAIAGGPIGAAVGAPAALLFDMIFF